MLISNKFNRLLRGIISEFRNQLVIGVENGHKVTAQDVKVMLCYKSHYYPKSEAGIPFSFTKIDNKQACDLVEFIFREGGQRGFTFGVIEDEWQRVLKEANIKH